MQMWITLKTFKSNLDFSNNCFGINNNYYVFTEGKMIHLRKY